MVSLGSIAFFFALRLLLFVGVSTSPLNASPVPQAAAPAAGTGYWLSDIKRQGTVAFQDGQYQIFRNVKDFGAKGDGSSDDTVAINNAISSGQRCGDGCDSTTTKIALVYFPPGTYVVSKPIIQYYYTQLVGDANSIPVIKAAASFEGMAVIDADPYKDTGANWYTNQNNFFRQVRNMVIDITAMGPTKGAGIHWQVAQATSLQNIRFEMVKGGADNKQLGIFMDNGSGGFMTDLTFNGGNYGAFLGSQQFTTRNLTFNGCNTAIFMNWNWAWTFKSVNINDCKVGIDMANGGFNDTLGKFVQTVGSVLLLDSKITNTPIGINSSFSADSSPASGGTIILDNVDCSGCAATVQSSTGATLLAGGNIKSWAQGSIYKGAAGQRTSGPIDGYTKPESLLTSDGKIYERAKPQYESVPKSSFVSIKDAGAKGDGVTDDTKAIQAAMSSIQPNQVLYFDHGAYIVTETIEVPKQIKMTGEIWPLIMASGPNFADQANPKPVFQVGKPGDTDGAVEISDLIFETAGPAPGAILMQWNLDASTQGSNGLWDTHFRIGGSAGTQLQSDKCSKNNLTDHSTPNPACIGAHTLFHTTTTASVYVENCWFWVADHELDLGDHNQIDIYNGRGVLLESESPVWLVGTSSEHSVLYNYQLSAAKNVFMGLIQTESPYFQSNPPAPAPFTAKAATDPDFDTCGDDKACRKAWGLRVVDSQDVLVYGAGLYSFFENYGQACLVPEDCQTNMVSVEGSTPNLNIFGLSTKASANMLSGFSSGQPVRYAGTPAVAVLDKDNRSNFCATLAVWRP